jgi:hypothetical protein
MEARERQATIDAAVKFRYDENARPLAPLSIGAQVDTESNNEQGVSIVKLGDDARTS